MPRGCRARLFNFLSVVFLGLSVVTLGWVVEIAANPYGRLNPLPPPGSVDVVVAPAIRRRHA